MNHMLKPFLLDVATRIDRLVLIDAEAQTDSVETTGECFVDFELNFILEHVSDFG